ncbi:uncharacterized protein PV09_01297 [Verruconis gallopava]|uniref:Uncharacterized protein n=1 Tax=Verruconis gallopava TaxID=253628 RepID=A0A0D2ANV9_9PEZI|nr:uncharacterized protein PV09_01297 [Verruconis gallopava]KIW08383.1 hypothetical protein PV09_01297 [Verruconis gallopava]
MPSRLYSTTLRKRGIREDGHHHCLKELSGSGNSIGSRPKTRNRGSPCSEREGSFASHLARILDNDVMDSISSRHSNAQNSRNLDGLPTVRLILTIRHRIDHALSYHTSED